MAYITREDGERFVIPSYRDVIAKPKSQIKDDIIQLGATYGEYITFQRRGLAQFEIAFAHDPGYLFGESVWHFFKSPTDLIYCEVIPEAKEAYVVIVAKGGIYLDGTFPLDNIVEELLVFTTQKNNFEIYVYGDVPLSAEPEEGKFSFEPALVKSFNVLEKPIFATMPVVKAYQLQLIDVVLRQQGIGVFPVKYVVVAIIILGLGWMGYSYMNMHEPTMPLVEVAPPPPENPYLEFNKALMSPPPDEEAAMVFSTVKIFRTLPGWTVSDLVYNPSNGQITTSVQSQGTDTNTLFSWGEKNGVAVQLNSKGFALTMTLTPPQKRGVPALIYTLDRVIANLIDRLGVVAHGNVVNMLGGIKDKKSYKEADVVITLNNIAPEVALFAIEQLKGLPLVLTSMSVKINDSISVTINLKALGN